MPILALFLAVAIFVMLCLVTWAYFAGDPEGQMVDEDSTMDVQNHQGDTRPVR